MNLPQFYVYLTPRPIDCMEVNYKPPQWQQDFIQKMVANHCYPQVNSYDVKIHKTSDVNGLIFLKDRKTLINSADYKEGDIFVIQHYPQKLDPKEFEIIKDYFSFLYFDTPKKEVSDSPNVTEKYLYKSGCFAGAMPRSAINEAKFSAGTTVIKPID